MSLEKYDNKIESLPSIADSEEVEKVFSELVSENESFVSNNIYQVSELILELLFRLSDTYSVLSPDRSIMACHWLERYI